MLIARMPRNLRPLHPWGPEANRARAAEQSRAAPPDAETDSWAEFARRYLEDGDILFCKGRATTLDGSYISNVLTHLTDSPFSHNGVARWEGDTVWVYDTKAEGVRKIPFVSWIHEIDTSTLAVRRLMPAYRARIPQALAFCEASYFREVPYDYSFDPGDEEFYCAELIEKAYRSAGLALSTPVSIRSLPNYSEYPVLWFILEHFTSINLDNPVYVPGTERYGTYGSPYLELVYQSDQLADLARRRRAPHTF